jgi:DNA-binding XRE family transcriptional regulator
LRRTQNFRNDLLEKLLIARLQSAWPGAKLNQVLHNLHHLSGGPMARARRAGTDSLKAWQDENPLKRWRLAQPPEGWNRSVMARKLGVSHTAVGSWESGKRLPVVDTFSKIEALTSITTVQWMEWYEHKPKEE